MPLTRDFRETVQARAKSDPAFRAGLYQEAVQCLLDGDLATARILLRDFINATVGLAALADRMGVHEKSLSRMLGKSGNPKAANLLAALGALRAECGLSVTVSAQAARPAVVKPRAAKGRPRPAAELRAA